MKVDGPVSLSPFSGGPAEAVDSVESVEPPPSVGWHSEGGDGLTNRYWDGSAWSARVRWNGTEWKPVSGP